MVLYDLLQLGHVKAHPVKSHRRLVSKVVFGMQSRRYWISKNRQRKVEEMPPPPVVPLHFPSPLAKVGTNKIADIGFESAFHRLRQAGVPFRDRVVRQVIFKRCLMNEEIDLF